MVTHTAPYSLHTERLLLRCWSPSDAARLARGLVEQAALHEPWHVAVEEACEPGPDQRPGTPDPGLGRDVLHFQPARDGEGWQPLGDVDGCSGVDPALHADVDHASVGRPTEHELHGTPVEVRCDSCEIR